MNKSTKDDHQLVARRIIERLKIFNRKERDHLMKFALCDSPKDPGIAVPFWRLVSGERGVQRPKEEERFFIGMDFHLNWLFAALQTAYMEITDKLPALENAWGLGKIRTNSNRNMKPIQGNQEDADVLVAWIQNMDTKTLNISMVEAKLDSPWKEGQLKKKLERLALIQASSIAAGLKFIEWDCLLVSPSAPGDKKKTNASAEAESHDDAVKPLQDLYNRYFRDYSSKGEPMTLRWREWEGQPYSKGRFSVNRLKKDHSRWKIVEK